MIEQKQNGFSMKIAKLIYAFTLISAAAIIFALYENLISLNLFIVYIFLGVVLGLAVVLLIQICYKSSAINN